MSGWLASRLMSADPLPFDPAPAVPPTARVVRVLEHERPGVEATEVELVAEEGSTVSAYLLRPRAGGTGPGILYSHWLEKAPDDNKTQFLAEALDVAARGHVCLLLDTVFADWPDSRLNWTGTDVTGDREIVLQQLRELRGALGFLRAQSDVDASRVALVGHDFGAMFNSILAGLEGDLRALVVMAAVPEFGEWFLIGSELEGSAREEYAGALADLAPARFLARAEVPVLFQFGEDDLFFVPRERAEALVASAAGPTTVRWYDSDHAIHHHATARTDRVEWLLERIS